ncbi:MAG: hypothetical protein AAF502_22885 [Bacteroidota bacterium]
MKKALLSLLLFFFTFASMVTYAQEENPWKTLAKLTYKMQYDEFMGFDVEVPVFSDAIKAIEGDEITLEGYIIPVEGYKQQNHFVFSAYPYNMCFFCGGAGRETVMEVYSKDSRLTYTSKPIRIKGRLELNPTDLNKLMFILHDAVLVSKNLE